MARQKRQVVDISKFGAVIQSLSRISGRDFESTVKAEAGHILSGAVTSTPKAKIKNIVKYVMPQGIVHRRNTGGKLISKKNGFNYHVGTPVLGDGINGSKYILPYTKWLGRTKWEEFLSEQRDKFDRRKANRGMGASQFYFMSKMLNIPLPRQPANYLKSSHLRNQVTPFLSPRATGQRRSYEIKLESRGMLVSKGTGAQRILMLKTQGRINNFKRAIKRNLFQEMEYRTSRYPLLFN